MSDYDGDGSKRRSPFSEAQSRAHPTSNPRTNSRPKAQPASRGPSAASSTCSTSSWSSASSWTARNSPSAPQASGESPTHLSAQALQKMAKLGQKKPKPSRGAKSHLLPASDVLQILLRNGKSELSDGFTRWKLEQQWVEVVGEEIARDTLPCAFDRGALHIWVRHSGWLQQLWFFKDIVRDKVNAHLGREWAATVRFTLDKRSAGAE